jgi:hypothetical protein
MQMNNHTTEEPDALMKTDEQIKEPPKIKFELVYNNVWIRFPCDICGGCTEKVSTLCEAQDPECDRTILVCETCLEHGDTDQALAAYAKRLEREAEYKRRLIGRLILPTFEQWSAANREHEGMGEFEA